MHVLLLATDEETRLQPLTETMPTPMLPLVNRPVIAYTLELLARAGQKRLLVSLYQRGGAMMSYLGSGSRWGMHIEYVMQSQPWGSAGALKWAAPRLNEPFLLLPADALLDLDIAAAVAYHTEHGGPATCIVHPASSPSGQPDLAAADLVAVDAEGRLVASDDRRAVQRMVATGAYIFAPEILQFIPARTPYDCQHQLLPALLAADVTVQSYTMSGYFNPLNSLRNYQHAQATFLQSAYTAGTPDAAAVPNVGTVRYPAITRRSIVPGVWVGRNHFIHPTARLLPPVYIGDNCRIGQNVEIGPMTVLGDNVIIDDEATVRQSSILEQTYVGRMVDITDRLVNQTTIIEPETGQSIQVVDAFLLAAAAPAGSWGGRFHRVLDRLGALLLFLMLLPLLLLLLPLVWLASGGALFQRETHSGRRATRREGDPAAADIETFDLLMFRTTRRDGTVNAVGRWLRRWELDRLPELVNVCIGDLALVGVKPLRPTEVDLVQAEWYQKRFECPAGFTGLWYIQTDPSSDLEEIVIADTFFAATRTWRSEIGILLRTPVAWLRRGRSSRRREPGLATIADVEQSHKQHAL